MKVAINGCYGGFRLSPTAFIMLAARKGIEATLTKSPTSYFHQYVTSDDTPIYESDLYSSRTDPDLIYVIETLGKEASGPCAALYTVDIPDDIAWEITEYDGMESVEEVHRSWS